ncbi:MAG: hypothetical protein EPN97_17920 [Alphaproteobacteria bacterium]|nr:MAG: hypothetical protein EPN97_17920 [Alphaproteobacteria bacterium]
MQLKAPLVRRFVGIFAGTIVLCLLVNIGLIRTWWMVMDHSSNHLIVHGIERGYGLTLPTRTKGPVPLVIALHGLTETGKIAKYRMRFDDVARREGFAVAYPDGIARGWTIIPPSMSGEYSRAAAAMADMDFIDALVDDLVKREVVDPHRVYLTGISNGGQLTFLLACFRPARYAAAAPIVATITALTSRACKAPNPMPMLIMAGTNDQYVFWNGKKNGEPIDNFLSVRDSLNFWKRVNGCSDVAVKQVFPHLRAEDPTTVQTELYSNCSTGKKVALYKIVNGGHQSPSIAGDDLWTPILGPRNHDIEASEEVWKFFKEYRK